MILLDKEERDKVYDALPNNATVGDERTAFCKAQLKKVVNLLNECCAGLDLSHPEYYENQDFVVFPIKYLQSLLKEMED